MIIVTLVATLAAAMVWQQWRAVQVESAERARAQAAWILSGALDFARLILREDQKSGKPTALTEPWATPLAESRLSTFLAIDKANADDGPEAFLSGSITDAQSFYNLRNLVDAGKPVPEEVAALKRLFQAIGVAQSLADTIANAMNDALSAPTGAGSSGPVPLMPQTLAQLAWIGVDDDSIQRMTPYVTLLPIRTAVNVNTAPKEVLVAAIDALDLGTAERMVQGRQRQPFKSLDDVQKLVPTLKVQSQRINVTSAFFIVRGRLRLEDRVLEQSSLVHRRSRDEVVVLSRQRESSRESTP
jgi:general secretion pathway protein K